MPGTTAASFPESHYHPHLLNRGKRSNIILEFEFHHLLHVIKQRPTKTVEIVLNFKKKVF